MPTDKELMQQALDALEYIHTETTVDEDELIHAAITALRRALKQPEKSEPVYIMGNYVGTGKVSSVTLGGVSFTGNGTAGREADVKPTGLFFQMPKQEPVAWCDHVEQRLLTWRQSFVNRSGDQLALDDFMDKRSLDDLIDFVCDEYTAPPQRDFKFSTIEEAMQPMLTPTGQPHLTDDEGRFATAFTALIKAGYGKEADIVLKCKPAWQGLTDEEQLEIMKQFGPGQRGLFADAIEAKLKEKNA